MDILAVLFDGTITNWELIGLLLLPGVVYGVKRGWQEEGFTAIGLAIVVSSLGQRFGDFLVLLFNRMIGIFPLGLAILLNKPPSEWPALGEGVVSPDSPVVELLAFVLMVLVSYRAGTILGRRKGVNLLGRVAGSFFGALNAFLVLARLLQIFNPLEEGREVDLPTIRILGLRAEMLASLIFGIIGLIIALFLFLAWYNRKRGRD